MVSRAHPVIPPDSADEGGAELKQTHQAVCNLADYISRTAALPDSHLESVVKALTYPIIVTSPAGVVALANGPAEELLGTEGLSVGNSTYAAYAAVEGASFDSALNAAVDPYQPISATLHTP